MCNTQLTTGLEGRWGFSCLGSFPLFVKRLTLIVSPRCECRRDMRWNTATGKLTQPAQKKNRKKTTISNPTPKLKNKTNHHKVSASYTWTWIAATSPTTAGPLKLCSGFKISDFFWNIKLGNLESYSTWKPDTLLRAVEDLKRQQQLQAVVQQDFGRTESYQVGGNKFIFLISPWLSYLTRRVWPPPSSPSWTARQPARPSWPRPSAEMLTPSALSLNDKWEADDDDSRWC